MAARKNQRMRTVGINDGQFQIIVERRARDIFPHRELNYAGAMASALI
jgi:hypothetical protein